MMKCLCFLSNLAHSWCAGWFVSHGLASILRGPMGTGAMVLREGEGYQKHTISVISVLSQQGRHASVSKNGDTPYGDGYLASRNGDIASHLASNGYVGNIGLQVPSRQVRGRYMITS